MYKIIINYATLIAFIGLTLDNIIQIYHIIREKSSDNISFRGESIRLLAVIILLTKFILIKEYFLVIGQTIFLTTFVIYLFVIIKYHKEKL